MAKFANIKLELGKITHYAHVDTLKKELNRLRTEILKRGESEVHQIERNVRKVRAKVQKLQKQIEAEVTKIRKQVMAKPGKAAKTTYKKPAKKAAKKARKTTAKRKTR